MTADQRRLLYAAPELVLVDLADAALGALVVALLLQHPSLDADDDPWIGGPSTLLRARRLARIARRLRAELDRYRLAIDQALREDPGTGLPF